MSISGGSKLNSVPNLLGGEKLNIKEVKQWETMME
jgi:hypothetical protein